MFRVSVFSFSMLTCSRRYRNINLTIWDVGGEVRSVSRFYVRVELCVFAVFYVRVELCVFAVAAHQPTYEHGERTR